MTKARRNRCSPRSSVIPLAPFYCQIQSSAALCQRNGARGMKAVLLVACLALTSVGFSQEKAANSDSVLDLPLRSLLDESVTVLDLGYSLNDRSPFWPGDDYEPFKLKTIATLEKNGVLSKAFAVPEHFGTHVDAPNHFERNQPAVDEIRPRDFFGPGVVIDVTMQAEVDANYRASQKDVEAWEQAHGKIPAGAIVFLKTGWGQHWKNPARYRNQDSTGRMRFPGFSVEAAKFLIEQRAAKALAIDTLSIDHGPSKDFAVHHLVNRAGRYAVENVAQLGKLPARNFLVVVAPIKIETGSGGPARVFAILKRDTTSAALERNAGQVVWKQIGTLSAPEAHQAAAADDKFAYAITNTLVAKYDRQSGERLAVSTGEAKHLNSGFLWDGRLFCAHSNYPQTPERSEIKVLDLDSMRLTTFKDFGNFGGSLTWAVRHDEHWWCNFARYGDDNAQTFLVKFNDEWHERGRWTYPPEVIRELSRMSLSGGLWRDGALLVTGHDDPVLFQLRLPKTGNVLEFVAKQAAPFTGQGIAFDPKTRGLVGIHRKQRMVVFANEAE